MPPATARSSISSRPYELKSIDQLPTGLLNSIKRHSLANQSIEGIFVIPAQSIHSAHMGNQTPLQALVFTDKGMFHVTETSLSRELEGVLWVSAEGIISIKISLILLYGKLEIWFFDLGQNSKVEIEFNTVGYPILSPMLHGLIRKTWEYNHVKFPDSLIYESIDDLYYKSFGFFNGLRLEGLEAEEKIVGYVFQPEIKVPRFKVFHHSIAPQTAIVVTNHQVIMLQQDLQFKKHHEEWIFTFCPLYRIQKVNMEDFGLWKKLSFRLTSLNQQDITVILEPPNAQRWRETWEKLNV